METALIIYAYLVLGQLFTALGVLATVVGLAYGFALIVMGAEDEADVVLKHWRKVAGIVVAAVVLNCLYPSKEDLAWIIGGAGIVSVAQTEEAQKLPDNVLKAANSFLEGLSSKEDAD